MNDKIEVALDQLLCKRLQISIMVENENEMNELVNTIDKNNTVEKSWLCWYDGTTEEKPTWRNRYMVFYPAHKSCYTYSECHSSFKETFKIKYNYKDIKIVDIKCKIYCSYCGESADKYFNNHNTNSYNKQLCERCFRKLNRAMCCKCLGGLLLNYSTYYTLHSQLGPTKYYCVHCWHNEKLKKS